MFDALPVVLVFEFVVGKEFEVEFGYVVAEIQNDRAHGRIIARAAEKVNSAAMQVNFVIEKRRKIIVE